ncbi:MAG TPA: hypothetical protein DCS87_04515 [Rheinheimera sp.]|nr:hypothetical protein [Rheinheimera sp.]
MSKKILGVLVAAAVLSFHAPVTQAQEQWSVSLCEYTKADDKNRIRKLLSDNKLNLRKIYDAVQCNKESLIKFAMRSDAYEVGAFFVKQMPAKSLKEEDLENWAKSNGMGESPLINDIRARMGED